MTLRTHLLMALVGLVCVFSGTSFSHAASIERVQNEHCGIALTGEIEKGDLEKLVVLDPKYVDTNAICLDSPGGSFEESIAISNFIRSSSLGTYVGENARCTSACAVIFMFGTFPTELGPESSRTMHVNAQVGFHRPSIGVASAGTFDSRDMEHAFDLALESIWEFLQLANDPNVMGDSPTAFPPDLLEKMLSRKGPEAFFYIDTIDKAIHFNIYLDGLRVPEHVYSEALYNMCNNTIGKKVNYWGENKNIFNMQKNIGMSPVIKAFMGGATRKNSTFFYIRSDYYTEIYPKFCNIYFSNRNADSAIPDSICTDMTEGNFDTNSVLTCIEDDADARWHWLDPRLYFARGTRLANANAISHQLETSGPPILSADGTGPVSGQNASTLRQECVPSKDGLTVTNVNEFVNLRSGPRLSDRIVAAAPLGTDLTFAGDIRVSGSGPVQKCHDLCVAAQKDALSSADQTALNSCYEDNLIWYRVQMSSGKSGWVSGKFLDIDE